MSYADQPTMSPRKAVAIGLVVLLHALLGYAFITGLAYNVVKKIASDTKVFDVAEEPPPPEEVPPPPPPPRPSQASAATPRGDVSSWVTTEDYPSRALREGTEGVTAVAWDVDASGRVVNCRVTASSGSSELDDAACKNITRRGRYKPALDSNGAAIASTSGYNRRVRWQIPKD
ncbi:energy transducer TonB [Sphingomonas solaris]|uniref:Energy transducer TonB n=1 Tax=Alterirhizorhabdus solaris TaxID=2529389 RepID=A0A558QT23_9SPHN|nr:energy transducer TonB [Sphingomonas solaris]TVV70264.1 energy transducer TonB [Sphingomonas solaris]